MANKAKAATPEPELRPDGWERFERAVDTALKSGPRHKNGAEPKPDRKPKTVRDPAV